MDGNSVQNSLDWKNEGVPTFSDFDISGKKSGKNTKIEFNCASGHQSLVSLPGADTRPSRIDRKRDVLISGSVEELAGKDGHTRAERERRKKIKNMFTNLHALLPQLPSKVDKTTIVDETLNYIQTLEQKLLNLQKQKLEMLQTLNYPPVFASINSTDDQGAEHGRSKSNSIFDPADAKNISNLVAPPVPRFHTTYKTWNSPNVALNVCDYDAHISICCLAKCGLLTSICCVLDKYKIEVLSAQVSSDHHRSMFMIHTRATEFTEEMYKQAAGEIIDLCV